MLQLAGIGEVAALGDAIPIYRTEPGGEGVGLDQVAGAAPRHELALDVPVGRGPERHPLAFALDDQTGGDGLHAAGGRPWRTLRHSTGDTS